MEIDTMQEHGPLLKYDGAQELCDEVTQRMMEEYYREERIEKIMREHVAEIRVKLSEALALNNEKDADIVRLKKVCDAQEKVIEKYKNLCDAQKQVIYNLELKVSHT